MPAVRASPAGRSILVSESVRLGRAADTKNVPGRMGGGQHNGPTHIFFLPWRVGHFSLNIDILHNKKRK
jgi:hypothetical protein